LNAASVCAVSRSAHHWRASAGVKSFVACSRMNVSIGFSANAAIWPRE
jgi:hypothetical protein